MVETTLLERYHLEDRIAAGGMGTVWAARDERLGRRVAVKLLKDELAGDPRFVERFRREARSVAALGHPHIASVFDYGVDGARHFIVMELIEGKDLARVLREDGPLSVDRAARIASQTCEALGHAHAAGVVHRDVKPANIIVASGDRVKVTDFGIARAAGDATLTATGSVLGTAHYLSPEQASGGETGPPADVYSMGCVLYEMLTGAVPFTGDSPIAIAMRHVSDDFPPPSQLNTDVPPALDEVVSTATAKEPSRRYPDGRAMAAAVAEAVAPTGAGTVVAAGGLGAGATAVLTDSGGTREMGDTVWPIPGDHWDPRRVGRFVLFALGALAVIALLLLLLRLTSGDDGTPARDESAGNQTETEAEPAEVTLEDYTGAPADDAEAELSDLGMKVSQVDQDSAEATGLVVDQEPAPGETVPEGETVTLFVSNGALIPEGDEDDEGDEDSSGPGNSEGKGKAKGKDKDED